MRISAFLLLCCAFSSFAANTSSQNAKVNINGKNLTIGSFIDQVEKQTDYLFVYSKNEVNVDEVISVKTGKKAVSQYLKDVFGDSDVRFAFENDYIVLTRNATPSVAQEGKRITGLVKDQLGDPIIGANVVVKGTTNGVITDIDGNFILQNVPANAVIQISYIGYLAQEIPVGNKSSFDILLLEDTQKLDEVVVVGYGTQKKVTLTGAVSAIQSDEIITTKNENAQNMLTGKIPGVRVMQKSAEPGSFNNNFDIRGMGDPLIIIDGVPRDNMTRLDPNDIESMSVLKDASAAIYGVRAANGVVLITTKKGKEGRVELEYSGNVGWQNPSGAVKSVSAADWMTLKNEKSMHNVNGGTLLYSLDEIEAYRNGTKQGTDWYDAVMRPLAPQTQHTLSARGGNEKTHYYMSAGYLYQESFLRSNSLNYDRFNVRSNVTSKITDRLTIDLNMSGIMDQKDQPYQNSDWIIRAMQRSPATQPIYANNNPDYLLYGWIEGDNPVAMMDADQVGYKKYNNKWFQTSAQATYDVPWIEGLQMKGMFSYDYQIADNKIYARTYNEYEYDDATSEYIAREREGTSTFRREHYTKQSWLYQVSLNYNHTFNEDHNVTGLLLLEGQRRDGDNFFAKRELALDLDQLFAGNTDNQEGNMSTGDSDLYQEANMGLVGKFGYDYKSKYLAEFSFRYDGSSMFGTGSQWGFFPSGSIGWRISEEDFWKDSKLSFINNAKIRASYGKLGDDSASSYQFITGYTYPASGDYNKRPGGYVFNGSYVNSTANKGIANTNITWYIAKTFDVGFDLDAWNRLLGLSVDYFSRTRTGLLATRSTSLPTVVGASLPQENLNGDFTQGFDLEISHYNRIGDFGYNLKGIFSYVRTKDTYIERGASGNSYENWRNNTNQRYQNIVWGYGDGGRYTSYADIANSNVYAGYSTLPGDYKYLDWNGDGIISDLDKYPIGYENRPLINFSLNIGADWKGFDLNLLFQGAAMQYNRYIEQLREPMWGNDYSNALDYFMDRWHPVDPTADPYNPSTEWVSGEYAYTGTLADEYSAYNVHNSSYVRLKSAELGYTFPQKWIGKSGIKNLRLYVNGYNLFTIKGVPFDPEHSGNDSYGNLYPLNRTFSVGVNVKF
ncbi:TonB-dependent receptor [Parabacteroides timonensis]|uniref:SusC/RagA family TonB-linked outer membrane protein n=1 Tax=Parabacteroides timonensis TaxID=1871013 RepID=UPI001F328179|nr:TonB-dependent receptor [Parabacteroides timonensis]